MVLLSARGDDGTVFDGSALAGVTRLGCGDAGRRGGGKVLREPRVGTPTAAATTRDRLDRAASADPLAHASAGAPPGPLGGVDSGAAPSDPGGGAGGPR